MSDISDKCGKKPKKTKPKMGGFTMPGYNDQPKPCLIKDCDGMVEPTWNANVGQCNTCEERYNWGSYRKRAKK